MTQQTYGSGCRMPSNDDYKELWNNTDQTYKTVDGVLCRKFAYRTDATKYILIPFASKCNETSLGDVNKYASYWTSTCRSDLAYFLEIGITTSGDVFHHQSRHFGCTVRAVKPGPVSD